MGAWAQPDNGATNDIEHTNARASAHAPSIADERHLSTLLVRQSQAMGTMEEGRDDPDGALVEREKYMPTHLADSRQAKLQALASDFGHLSVDRLLQVAALTLWLPLSVFKTHAITPPLRSPTNGKAIARYAAAKRCSLRLFLPRSINAQAPPRVGLLHVVRTISVFCDLQIILVTQFRLGTRGC